MGVPKRHCLVAVFHETSFLRFQVDDGGARVPASLEIFGHPTSMGLCRVLSSEDRVDGGHLDSGSVSAQWNGGFSLLLRLSCWK